jgi:hypothetical protein
LCETEYGIYRDAGIERTWIVSYMTWTCRVSRFHGASRRQLIGKNSPLLLYEIRLKRAGEQADSGHGFLADLARSVIQRSEVADLKHLFRQASRSNGNGPRDTGLNGPLSQTDGSEDDVAIDRSESQGSFALSAPLTATQISLL